MAIPAGVILIHVGTHASIPTGWSRETALDDKYPKAWGAAVAPNTTGGANVHTHTGAHTHTLGSHYHSITSNAGTQQQADDNSGSGGGVNYDHYHVNVNLASISGGGAQSTTVTWSSINQEPPYYTVIFIKPTGTVAALPAGICAHYYGTSAPILWNFCDGTNSTPDLRNKYLKGATTNANAGTTGGGTSHSHTTTHGHTATAHSHSGASGVPNAGRAGGGDRAGISHTHTITLANATEAITNYTNTTSGSGDTVEVAYKKLGVIKATVGSARKGMVGLWLGSVASIPLNWVLCDGNNGTHDLRDKFVKIGAALANNNETGGANTHSHTAVSHTHVGASHTHSFSYDQYASTAGGPGGQGANNSNRSHTHTWNQGANTTSYASINISADTVDNQPAYRTAAYIQLAKLDLGGAGLYNML